MGQEKLLNEYLNTAFPNTGTLYELLNNENCEANNENFVVPIGKDSNGIAIYQDLSQISHILISGTTGSGKTTFIQSILSSLLLTLPTDAVKFVIYDSKHIDYTFFKDIPQLLIPIITDSRKALGAISWALQEANNRIALRTERSIEFNKLPHIFLIFDDYSEIAMQNEGLESLIQLLRVGRVANIHCILATSTPTTNIVSTEIKANVPCRIAFHTTQKSISRMILDENGAEMLQIPGEMIFKGQNQNIKCTSFYISDEEIKSITQQLVKNTNRTLSAIGNMAASVFGSQEEPQELDDSNDIDDLDTLFSEAVELALELGQISTAMLVRRLKIGYARAARLLDQMEQKKIISGFDGSNPRRVLISKSEYKDSQSNQITKEDVVSLRPFPKIESLGESIEVKDNLIYVKKITKKQGPYTHTAEYTFNSERLNCIIYNKPKLFSKGAITFVLKPNSWNINDDRIDKNYTADLPKTELTLFISKNNAGLFEQLAKQIATDCSIEVRYV